MEEKLSILAIDDTAMQLHALSNILQPTYKVRVAKDGKSGIASAIKYKPNLILLDMVMPGMSGLEVLQVLKTTDETQAIPVLIVSGSNAEDDIKKCLDFGADAYITKPYTRENVMEYVEMFCYRQS